MPRFYAVTARSSRPHNGYHPLAPAELQSAEQQSGTALQKPVKSSSTGAPTSSSSGLAFWTVPKPTDALDIVTIYDPEQWESKRLEFSFCTTNKCVVEWKDHTRSPSILDLATVSSLAHDIQDRSYLTQYQAHWYIILIGRLLYGDWPPGKSRVGTWNGYDTDTRDAVERIALAASDVYHQEMDRIGDLLRAEKHHEEQGERLEALGKGVEDFLAAYKRGEPITADSIHGLKEKVAHLSCEDSAATSANV